MTINLSKLKELAEAAKRDPYDNLAANDYGMSMPPATALELIAEIERHRQVNAEGCKPDLNEPIHPDDMRAIVEQHREFMKLTDHEWMDSASTLQDRAYALGRARGKAEQNILAEQHQSEPAGEIVAFGHGLHEAAVEHGLDKAEGCKPDLINQPFFYALAGPDGKPHYDDFCVADSPADLECHEEGITIVPLYRHPAPSTQTAELTDVLPTAAVEGDQLAIRITTECLLHAVTCSSQWPTDEAGEPIRISNGPLLIQEIIHELQREDEQGTNAMHRMFDEAALHALNNGSEAVDYSEVDA